MMESLILTTGILGAIALIAVFYMLIRGQLLGVEGLLLGGIGVALLGISAWSGFGNGASAGVQARLGEMESQIEGLQQNSEIQSRRLANVQAGAETVARGAIELTRILDSGGQIESARLDSIKASIEATRLIPTPLAPPPSIESDDFYP